MLKRIWSCVCLAFLLTFAAAAQNPVLDWDMTAVNTALTADQSVSPASATSGGTGLYLAYMHLAVYNAVNAIDGKFQPYYSSLPLTPQASREAAASAAAYFTLRSYFPLADAALTAQYEAAIALIPDSASKTAGVALGQAAATELIANRANDGRGAAVPYTFPSTVLAGVWVPTPPAFAAPQTPWVGQMKPFTMTSASQFLPEDGPTPLDSDEWARDYNETKSLGAANSTRRTPKQTEIGLFWTEQTARQYARALRQLATAQNLDLPSSSRMMAMVWTAYADSFIGCMNAKYHFSFWRPVTAIRNGDLDGNADTAPDLGWAPLATTPNHPEFPAAHGCVTGALTATLRDFFGTRKISFPVSSTVTGNTHNFTDLRDLESEVFMARIYAGFHYRNSLRQGFALGHAVGNQLTKNFFRATETD